MALKVGDRVKVYVGAGPQNFKIGKVVVIDSDSIIQVLEDKPVTPGYHIVYAHPKQYRKLLKRCCENGFFDKDHKCRKSNPVLEQAHFNDIDNALKIMQMIRAFNNQHQVLCQCLDCRSRCQNK